MKQIVAIVLAAIFSAGQAYAMTKVETPGATASVQDQMEQSGKVDAIHAAAGRMVIGRVPYGYNPLTTVVTVNGKRATVSDVRSGEIVKFQTSPQGANKPALLTTISVQRQ